MAADHVVSYIKFIKEASEKFKINPLITLTTVDDLCFDSTVPILFNQQNQQDKANAQAYFEYRDYRILLNDDFSTRVKDQKT